MFCKPATLIDYILQFTNVLTEHFRDFMGFMAYGAGYLRDTYTKYLFIGAVCSF